MKLKWTPTLVGIVWLLGGAWVEVRAATVDVVWHCSRYATAAEEPEEFDELDLVGEAQYSYIDNTFLASRNDEFSMASVTDQAHADGDLFYLTSAYAGVIALSLLDLYDAFSGTRSVFIGPQRLSACVTLDSTSPLNVAAADSVGVQPHVLQQLAKRSAISQSFIRIVRSEQEVQACIARHHPAVGYLSEEVVTEKIAPCF
jgi:hypothetical protein